MSTCPQSNTALRTGPAAETSVPAAPAFPVRRLCEQLRADGYATYLIGACVRDLMANRAPERFELVTEAPFDRILERFGHAVPIDARVPIAMIPTEIGPVDLVSLAGDPLDAALGRRVYGVDAIALDPASGTLHDPLGGRADLVAGRLRLTGGAERLREQPFALLRAVRLAGEVGLAAGPETRAALSEAAAEVRRIAPERVRRELAGILLTPHVGLALDLLHASGIAAVLAPGAATDSAAVVAALPPDLELRLAALLRGTTGVRATLRQLRYPRALAERIAGLLAVHPIDRTLSPVNEGAVRRLVKRVSERGCLRLVAIRRAELGAQPERSEPEYAQASARLDAVESAIAEARRSRLLARQRSELALGGREIMQLLGLPAGPQVGRALAYLTKLVAEDSSRNNREALISALSEWAKAHLD